jgi:hypothetical protein
VLRKLLVKRLGSYAVETSLDIPALNKELGVVANFGFLCATSVFSVVIGMYDITTTELTELVTEKKLQN